MIRLLALLGLLFVTPAFGQADVVANCGSVTIKAGTPHNVTVDLTGASCRQGGGGGGSSGAAAVWSTSDAAASGFVLSNGGATMSTPGVFPGGVWKSIRGTTSKLIGKFYVEYRSSLAGQGNGDFMVGMADAGFIPSDFLSTSIYSFGTAGWGARYASSGFTSNYDGANNGVAPNGVYGIAVDFDAGKEWLSYNGVWYGGGNPATGAAPQVTFTTSTVGPLFPAMSSDGGGSTGGWTLNGSVATQTYAPPAGFIAWDSGTGICPEASAYLARTTGSNEGGNPTPITMLICGLVTDGVWPKLDAFYVMAQQNRADALLNLVGTNYPLTGSAGFTTFRGFSGFNILDTGLNPATATGLHYTQNNASLGVWTATPGTFDSSGSIGTGNVGALGESNIYQHYSDGGFYLRINDQLHPSVPSPAFSGLFAGDRPSSTSVTPYWNGASQGASASTAVLPNNGTFGIGAGGNGFTTPNILSEVHFGGALGDAGNLALYNRLKAYMEKVGNYCPQATAYFARATGETAHKADLARLICGLIEDGVWAKLDAFYLPAQQTQADAMLNLVGTNYALTVTTAGTFTPYLGFVSGAYSTNFNAATAISPKFIQNSASFGLWNNAVSGALIMGNNTNSGLWPNYLGQFYARVNNISTPGLASSATYGLFIGDRSSVPSVDHFVNGVNLGTTLGDSEPPGNGVFYLGVNQTDVISASIIGASLGAAGQLAFNNRLRTYLTAVGWTPPATSKPGFTPPPGTPSPFKEPKK